jgi:NADH:ubiquinone oxidoreductase subunit 6 (subunit J)
VIRYKKIDLGIQLFLTIATIIFLILANDLEYRIGFNFFHCYLGLGATQVISAVTHFFMSKTFRNSRARIVYSIFASIALLLFAILLMNINGDEEAENSAINLGFILLITTPVLAISYMIICWSEIRNLNKANEV